MDSQYSEENSMESHTEDDNSITTEESDKNSSEEEQSNITTENSSEEEIDPWTTLINDAASKSGISTMTSCKRFSWRVTTKVQQNRKPLKMFYLFSKRNWAISTWITWHGWKALKKDPIRKKIMVTRDDYVNNNMFDPDEAIAAAVKKRKFLLKRLLEDQGRFPEQ